jgi:hypothetical protein
MPVSLLPEDALQGFGIQAGLHRVVSSEWMVHQFTDKTGKTFEPFVCWAIGYQPIDEKGAVIGDTQIDYSIKVGPKFGDTIDKSKFAPGIAPGQPLPLRIGSKGPYLEPVSDQQGLYKNSKPILYIESLAKAGFDVKKLAEASFNVGLLVGTEGDVYELVSQNDGTDETGKKFNATKIPAFKSIRKMGYEVQGIPQTGAAAPAGGKANGAVAAAHSANSTGNAQGLAVKILEAVVSKNKEKGAMPRADIVRSVLAVASKLDPRPAPEEREAAKGLLGSDAFYGDPAVEMLGILEGENFTFA